MGERDGIPGAALARLLERAREREQRLAPELVAWIGARAADALHDAGSVLDEPSLASIFLTYDGRVVLTGPGEPHGRAPPEPRADVFSLGAALYEAAVGTSPSRSPAGGAVVPPASLVPGFPEELSAILLRALAPDPELRPATAAELSRELDHFTGQNASASSLSELLAVYFEDERASHAPSLGELAPSPALVRSAPPGLATTARPTAASVLPSPHEKPSRWGLLVLAVALAMVVASLFAVKRPSESGEARGASAGSSSPRAPAPADPPATAGNNAVPAISAAPGADGGGPRFVP